MMMILILMLFTDFLKFEISAWMGERDIHIIQNEQLHELDDLCTWLQTRIRNFMQTRQRDLIHRMGISKDWADWFNHQYSKTTKVKIVYRKPKKLKTYNKVYSIMKPLLKHTQKKNVILLSYDEAFQKCYSIISGVHSRKETESSLGYGPFERCSC